MNILVINAGSSSLKYQLIDIANETMLLKGLCDRIGMKGGSLTQKTADGRSFRIDEDMPTHKEAIELVLKALVDKEAGAISSVSEIGAVGHRVLHSGEDFHSSVVIDDEVVRICEKNAELGPLHMPGNIACIKSCREVMPGVPMVAVFDTTFHSTMPPKAYMYGIPYSVYQQYKIRKYGFHGTSHKFVSEEAVKYLGAEHSRIIICHLGNGSSISAVKDGKCIDTSMGFTPLEGLIMGTRSGDIDPAAVEFLRVHDARGHRAVSQQKVRDAGDKRARFRHARAGKGDFGGQREGCARGGGGGIPHQKVHRFLRGGARRRGCHRLHGRNR